MIFTVSQIPTAEIDDYEDHDPIIINGDSDFREKATAENWDGDGSISNPYVIENYYFQAEMSFTNPAGDSPEIYQTDVFIHIIIKNTLVSYIISNNYFEDGIIGIFLQNTTNGEISDNIFAGVKSATVVFTSYNIRIENNDILYLHQYEMTFELQDEMDIILYGQSDRVYGSDPGEAVVIIKSSLIYVISNNFNNQPPALRSYNAIEIRESASIYIWDNLFEQTTNAVRLYEVNQTQIISNSFNNQWSAINTIYSSYNLIVDNIISNTDYRAIAVSNVPGPCCPGPSSNSLIIGNVITNAEVGIYLTGDFNSTIRGNSLIDNREYGINSQQFTPKLASPYEISSNIFEGNGVGLRLEYYTVIAGDFVTTIEKNNFLEQSSQVEINDY